MAAKQEVVQAGNNAVPAYMQKKTTTVGNVDASDLIIPRIKLLQAISPELEAFEKAKAGVFWHTLAEQPIGDRLTFIPILIRKTFALWAPRGDNRGILARSNDAVNWDVKDVFKVKVKNVKEEQVWDTTAGTVAGSGLDKFGSSVKGDANSAPAASLTYNVLMYCVEHPDLSPSMVIATRSAVKPAKALISKIEMRPVDHFGQQFAMGITKEQGDEGPYYGYSFTADGYASEELYKKCGGLYEKFRDAEFRANDEGEDLPDGGGGAGGGTVGGAKGKF